MGMLDIVYHDIMLFLRKYMYLNMLLSISIKILICCVMEIIMIEIPDQM